MRNFNPYIKIVTTPLNTAGHMLETASRDFSCLLPIIIQVELLLISIPAVIPFAIKNACPM